MAAYSEVNDAINKVFLTGRYEGRPLYLVLDDECRQELASLLGTPVNGVESYCCKAVGDACSALGSPFGPFFWFRREWLAKGAVDAPPFTALLYTLAHAAELMVSDADYSSGNYYQRLAQVTGVPYDRLSRYGGETPPFWLSLSDWLSRNDYAFGRPTARSTGYFKYVSMAISQAIVREAERKLFHDMFARFHFSGSETFSIEEMEHHVAAWINGPGANDRLRSAWAKAELRPRICEAALSELESWSETQETELADGGAGRATLSLVLAIVRDSLGRKLVFSLGRETELTQGLRLFADGKTGPGLEMANSVYGNFATIGPRTRIDISSVLLSGAKFTDEKGKSYSWRERLVIPFSKSENGPFWGEARRVSIGENHCVLVRDVRDVRTTVEGILGQAAVPGFTVAKSSEVGGLPASWLLYENVQFLRSLNDVPEDLSALAPLSDVGKLELEGGIKLARNIWHRWKPPLVRLEATGGTYEIKVFEGSSADGELIHETGPLDGTAQLELSSIEIPESGALHVTAGKLGEVVSTATFLLRSGLRPRKFDKPGQGQLGYRSVFTASQLESPDTGRSVVAGNQVELDVQSLRAVSNLLDFREIGAGGAIEHQTPRLAEIVAAPATKSKAKTIEEAKAEFLSKNCVERGKHHWKIPEKVPRYDSFLKTCKDCQEAVVDKRSRSRKGFKAKTKISSNISPPPPPAPRSQAHINEDLVLDALCFLGCGSWGSFERLVVSEIEEPWEAQRLLKDLVMLGHLDVELDRGSGRARAWCVAAPALAYYAPGEAVLSGFRNKAMLEDAVALLTGAGAELARKERIDQPLVYRFKNIPADDARRELSCIADPLGRQISVVEDVPKRLASACCQLWDGDLLLVPASIGSADFLQRYDVAKGKWVRTTTASEPGAYRYQLGGMEYAFVDQHGEARRGPHEIVKLLAAKASGEHLHAYDTEQRTFISRLGCEPIGLLGRVLVSCSGELPMTSDGKSVFSNVPPDIASCVLGLLYDSGDTK